MKSAKRKRDAGNPPAANAGEPRVAATVSKPVAARAIALASHCTIKDAAQLKGQLYALLSDAGAVTLDIGNVQRIDTASIQLLCVFVRDRRAADHAVKWLGTSAAMAEAARLLGVSELLALPALAEAAA